MSEKIIRNTGSSVDLLLLKQFLTVVSYTNSTNDFFNSLISGEYLHRIFHNDDNISISNDMKNAELLIQRNIKNLVNCISEEPVELGTEVSYSDYFINLRNDENYNRIFRAIIENYHNKIKQSIVNLMSMVPYEKVYAFEESFVINQLASDNILLQEYALNTISLWNNSEIIKKISGMKLKSRILQKRLDKILSFYGVTT